MEGNSGFNSSEFGVGKDRRKKNLPVEKDRRAKKIFEETKNSQKKDESIFLKTAETVLPCVKNMVKAEKGIEEKDYYQTVSTGFLAFTGLKESLKLVNKEFKIFAGTPTAIAEEVAKQETKSAVKTICFGVKRASKMGFLFAILLQIPILYKEIKK